MKVHINILHYNFNNQNFFYKYQLKQRTKKFSFVLGEENLAPKHKIQNDLKKDVIRQLIVSKSHR